MIHKLKLTLKTSKIKLILKAKKSSNPFDLFDQYLIDKILGYLKPNDVINLADAVPHSLITQKANDIKRIRQQHPTICPICLKHDGHIIHVLQLRLCKQCSELPEFKLICKSTAKNEYYLTENDLTHLRAYYVPNPHYKRAPAMNLFILQDVYNYFCYKYRCPLSQMDQIKNDLKVHKENRAKQVKNSIENRKNQRKIQLEKALNEYHLTLRADSKLCAGYIDGTIKDWTIAQIVQRMCQMKFLYEYCFFQKAFEDARDEYYEELRYGYRPDTSIFDLAEQIALRRCGGYPKVFPWMISSTQ